MFFACLKRFGHKPARKFKFRKGETRFSCVNEEVLSSSKKPVKKGWLAKKKKKSRRGGCYSHPHERNNGNYFLCEISDAWHIERAYFLFRSIDGRVFRVISLPQLTAYFLFSEMCATKIGCISFPHFTCMCPFPA